VTYTYAILPIAK